MAVNKIAMRVLLIAPSVPTAAAEQKTTAQMPSLTKFVGCYRLVALSSVPPDLPAGVVPQQFELTDRPTAFGRMWFQLHAAGANDPPSQLHHIWSPQHNNLKVQFGWGMGGWRGTLKQLEPNQFGGQLKPFCDSRCAGQSQLVTVRVKRVACLN